MRWRWWTSHASVHAEQAEADRLAEEIWNAHGVWVLAQSRFEVAVEQDEIDYAIYMLEAAEKRYDMLIRRAKAAGQVNPEWKSYGC